MPRSSAARQYRYDDEDEMSPDGPIPPSEQSRYEPRFRVVTRKSLVAPRPYARTVSAQRMVLLVAVPGVCLVLYVMFWTMAMRGGYLRGELERQIREARVERASLEAEKQRLQSSELILEKAKKLGMEPPAMNREFAHTPETAERP
ncbi:MAG: hypothetical protein ACK47B_10605 [Armatimonadota bacterium]